MLHLQPPTFLFIYLLILAIEMMVFATVVASLFLFVNYSILPHIYVST